MSSLNKKGYFESSLTIVLVVFLAIILFVVTVAMYNGYKDSVHDAPAFANVPEKVWTGAERAWTIFDYMVLLWIVGVVIAFIISLFYIRTAPLFFFIMVFTMIITITIAVMMSNVFESVVQTDTMSNLTDFENEYPVSTTVMSNYPLIILVILAIGGIVYYSKTRDGGAL